MRNKTFSGGCVESTMSVVAECSDVVLPGLHSQGSIGRTTGTLKAANESRWAMATSKAQLKVEKWIREQWLPGQYPGKLFESRFLTIGTKSDGSPATHQFDAVSVDGEVVASVKASSGRTRSGRYPSAKVSNAIAELYYLSCASAKEMRLVLVDPEFCEIVKKKVDGIVPDKVEILLAEGIPPELESELAEARKVQSDEMG
ncbi:MAG: hypothetical protein JRN54_06095 [Nitrososphaerota archaeon]|nr:hypothetical protein [Nitrososphaerota archaeon]